MADAPHAAKRSRKAKPARKPRVAGPAKTAARKKRQQEARARRLTLERKAARRKQIAAREGLTPNDFPLTFATRPTRKLARSLRRLKAQREKAGAA